MIGTLHRIQHGRPGGSTLLINFGKETLVEGLSRIANKFNED